LPIRRAYLKQLDFGQVQSHLLSARTDAERFLILCSISPESDTAQVQACFEDMLEKGVSGKLTHLGMFYQLNFAQRTNANTARLICSLIASPYVTTLAKIAMLNVLPERGINHGVAMEIYAILDPLIKAKVLESDVEYLAISACLEFAKCQTAVQKENGNYIPIKNTVTKYLRLERDTAYAAVAEDVISMTKDSDLKMRDVVESIELCLIDEDIPKKYRINICKRAIFECTDGYYLSQLLPTIEKVWGKKITFEAWKERCEISDPNDLDVLIEGLINRDDSAMERDLPYILYGLRSSLESDELLAKNRNEVASCLIKIINDPKVKIGQSARDALFSLLKEFYAAGINVFEQPSEKEATSSPRLHIVGQTRS